jgi:hypothetical protein
MAWNQFGGLKTLAFGHFKNQISKVLVVALAISSNIFFIPIAQAAPTVYSSGACSASVTATGAITSTSVSVETATISGVQYCLVKFKTSTAYTPTFSGNVTSISYLLVGGGGGGNSGGGGAGGFLEGTLDVSNKNISLTVGSGGSGGSGGNYPSAPVGTNGAASLLSNGVTSITAVGGGRGGYAYNSSITNGALGGSGGGGPWDGGNSTAGSGTSGQGFAGGTSSLINYKGGGGGGGASAVGLTGTNVVAGSCGGPGGAGGAGKASTISGISVTYAGGGGGGVNSNCNSNVHAGGAGGVGSGGKGSSYGYASGVRGANANATAGTANTGGGGGGTDPEDSGAGAGGSGIVMIRYLTDVASPTLSATSFNVNENLTTPYTAATITFSESSTVSSVAGADNLQFNLLLPDSITVVINFKTSPDYEIPTDSGGDNVYEISFIATDFAGNATSAQLIMITVSNVLDTSAFNSLALAGSVPTASYRTAIVITASVSVAAKVTFTLNGKTLPGCKGRLASGSGSTYISTCVWKPSMRGTATLRATASPIANGIPNATASPLNVFINKRTGIR